MPSFYFFTYEVASKIIDSVQRQASSVEVSLDLNLSRKPWSIRENQLLLDNDERLSIILLEGIKPDDNKIYMFKDQALTPLEVRSDGYYKLVPTRSAPTLEINGIKMHRSKDIDPLTDARLKAELVVKKDDRILDTCGGLGYSALWALKAGAAKVISTEKNKSVLFLRDSNPWTPDDKRIELIQGDILNTILNFEDRCFKGIIHDPPRFSSATGDLYGRAFYAQLFRVLAFGGKLFHYTGSPKKIKENDRFLKNTQKRLEQSGFTGVEFIKTLQGFLALKK